jgi:phosphosulfolactate synthase
MWPGRLVSPLVPDFLDLPERPTKPRESGLTHVIDIGLAPSDADNLMKIAADHIDLVRLGFGSAYVTGALQEKIDLYRGYGVPVALGGTLTELAWLQGRVDGLRTWLKELGVGHVEVSSGSVAIPPEEKVDLIRTLAEDFTVYAEVGEKDPAAIMAPYVWVELIEQALEAGAQKVVCEGRASGDAGLYRRDGEPRTGLLDEVVHSIDFHRLIFEAPQRHQQVWFIEHLGPEVNLGNIRPDDVIPLETLRLGLRADTLHLFHRRD